MENFKNSARDAQKTINDGELIQSPRGLMLYLPNQQDLIDHEGGIITINGKSVWSEHTSETHWPDRLYMEDYSNKEWNNYPTILPLSYSVSEYEFPKKVGIITAVVHETESRWELLYPGLGRICYLPEHGLAYIDGVSKSAALLIYSSIYTMYVSNGTNVIMVDDILGINEEEFFNDNF